MAKQRKAIPVVRLKECCGCVVCVDSCPVDCLSLTIVRGMEPRRRYPYLPNPETCIGCGRCAEDCPVDAIEMKTEETKPETWNRRFSE